MKDKCQCTSTWGDREAPTICDQYKPMTTGPVTYCEWCKHDKKCHEEKEQ